MPSNILIALDYSTTSTGYAIFEINPPRLVDYGLIKPNLKAVKGTAYPETQLLKMLDIGEKVLNLIENYNPDLIVIEEVTGGKQRLGQKVLNGGHFILLNILRDYLPNIRYYDVSGKNGWRTHLQMRYSETDKLHNKEAKKLNPSLGRGQKLPKITHKTLACRYANRHYNTDLDETRKKTDEDMADAICLGASFLKFGS